MDVERALEEVGIVGGNVFLTPLLDVLAENGVRIMSEEDVIAVTWSIEKYYKGKFLNITLFLRDGVTVTMSRQITAFTTRDDRLVEEPVDSPWNVAIFREVAGSCEA